MAETQEPNETIVKAPPSAAHANFPERVGPYRILGVLGEGGMGVVYLAEQTEPVRRRVALKLIRAGLDSRDVLARFDGERQALARLSHAGIAKVFDAGRAEDGRPYFVMEHVDGPTITEYCNRHTLDLAARVRLFVQVCEAVHHAHLNAIIHRDLSPQNILVAEESGAPAPKIIDFGIAKSLGDPLTQSTVHTRHHAMLGKPAYMPPEQAGLAPAHANATADIYSLGVVLYELLAGALPFDESDYAKASSTGFEALIRLIREGEPPRPSDRVTRIGAAGESLAAARELSSPGLARSLRNELDWICMRAIEKDPVRRYSSAAELAAELRRYLAGEAVLAGPPTTWYRLRKAARRHRVAVATGGAVVLALAIGLSVATAMFLRAEQQRREALRQGYLANIRAAAASLRDGEVKEARRWLDACHPSLRGWEWGHLHDRTDASAHRVIIAKVGARGPAPNGGRSPRVVWASFAPDGRSFATTSSRGRVEIWSADGGEPRLLRDYQVPGDKLAFGSYSPDGSRLVIATIDGILRVWDLGAPAPAGEFRGPSPNINAITWSPDGRAIAIASDAAYIALLDASSGAERARYPLPGLGLLDIGPTGIGASALRFTNDGRRLLAGRQDGVIQVLDVTSGATVRLYTGHGGAVIALAFDPVRPRLVSASVDQTVRVWNTATGEMVAALGEHRGNVNGVSFTADGRWFATSSYDKTVRIWDAASLRCTRTLFGHESYVYPVSFSPDGRYLLSGDDDATVRLWERAAPANPMTANWSAPLGAVLALPGGHYVTGDANGRLALWREGRTEPDRIVQAHHVPIADLDADPSGLTIVSVAGSSVRRWSATLDSLFQARIPDGIGTAVAIDGAGSVAVGTMDGTIHLWARGANPPRSIAKHASWINGLAFSPDGGTLASTSWDTGILTWDVATGDTLSHRPPGAAFLRMAYTPAGDRLVVGSWFGMVTMWDVASRSVVAELGGHNSIVHAVATTPDGDRLVTASQDRTLRLWNADSGDPLITLEGHGASIADAVVSRDGRTIITVAEDGSIMQWRR